MTLSRGLLIYFLKQALPATLCLGWALGLYTLFYPRVMTARDVWPLLIVLVYALVVAGVMGRSTSPAFAFIHSRGHKRGIVWAHMMLACAVSLLEAWLPAALIVWTGVRSRVQMAFRNPNFPLMAPLETHTPLVWLALLALLVVVAQYAWIRQAQPARGGLGGLMAAAGIIVAVLAGFVMLHHLYGWLGWLAGGLYAATVLAALLGGRVLYRTLEVQA